MKIPSIDTGIQIFLLAILLVIVIGITMIRRPDLVELCLTSMTGIFAAFLAASLDLKKAKVVDDDD